MSAQHNSPNSDVVILTALPIEYRAVVTHLQNIEEILHPSGTVYQRGTFFGEEHSWDVAVCEIGMGGPVAALETERAINFFRPAIVFFVGVAGGLKDVEIGDVVVASKVYAYESGKVSQRFEPVPEIWRASYELEQRAVEEARNRKWLARLDKNHLGSMPRVFIGALAAGEKIISSTKSIIYQLLRASYADALAVEMEGRGFLQAVHVNPSVRALVIRGISDLIDKKIEVDTTISSREMAAYHAAAFAFEVLANYSLPGQKDLEGKDTRNFGNELRKLRLRAGLAQHELADAVDVSPKTIARWEAGDFVPRRELLRNMIAFFLSRDVFTKGKEQVEAESFWRLLVNDTVFDVKWFVELLKKKTTSSPITVFYSYAREDESLCNELEKHLSVLKRQRFITEWHNRKIVPGTDWAREIDPYFLTASVILLLVSPDFLASDYIYSEEIVRAFERHKANEARVIPIILRPVDWFDAPFAHLQALPRDAKPVTTWANRDEAFLDISKGIRYACEELSTSKFPIPEFGFPSQPPRFYQLYEIFLKSGVPKVTFVEREDFELLKLSLAQPGRGVVIEGPSGIGKTTAVEKAVEALLSQQRIATEMQILSARNVEHRNRLQTIRQWHTGTIIIDDFHRLNTQLQNELIDYIKYLADTEPLSKKLVIVGIPQTGQTLVDTSFDVATRIDVFRLSLVNDELLLRMIEKGEEALNIKFDRKAEIVLAASGSLNIAQFLCFNICYRERFIETQEQLRVVSCDIDGAVNGVLTNLSRKFRESIRRFAAHTLQ